MNVPVEAVSAIERWMRTNFPDAYVESREIFERVVVLFRASEEATYYELEVTGEAFRKQPTGTILDDLENQEVARRLRNDPSLRLQYRSSRVVPHFETRYVSCDGRQYRIVRDSNHNVQIFDSADQLLEETPPGLRVMQNSVYRRSREEWCREIRSRRSGSDPKS